MFRRILVLVALLGLMGFGFSQFTTCTNITNPGSYTIDSAVQGNLTFGVSGSDTGVCIFINVSNVDFSCNGNSVTGNETGASGVLVADALNVTVRDCPAIGNYTHGVRFVSANNSFIINSTAYNNSDGFSFVSGSRNNTITNNTALNNSIHGFSVTSSNNSFTNNTAHGNFNNGFDIENSENNTFIQNLAFNNTLNGFYTAQANYNIFTNNWAFRNHGSGFRPTTGISNTFNVDYAYENEADGFYVEAKSTNIFNSFAYNNSNNGISNYIYANGTRVENTTSFNNTIDGVSLAYSNNSILTNVTSYENLRHGFIFTASHSNTITDVVSRDNGVYGFDFLLYSSNSTILNSQAYNNTNYGVWLAATTGTNTFTNTFVYNQSKYLFQQTMAAQTENNFTNFTVGYDAAIGQISFDFLNLTGLDLNFTDLILDPYFVSLNDSDAVQANASANITIYTEDCAYPIWQQYGFPQTRADILAGFPSPITPTSCTGASSPFTELFPVGGFSGYTTGDTCVDLSNMATWGAKIVNDSVTGSFYINRNVTLCTATYNVVNPVTLSDPALVMNASNIFLDCNSSTVSGEAGSGDGIYSSNKENNTIRNCMLALYNDGIYLEYSNGSQVYNNTGHDNGQSGINTLGVYGCLLANNTLYNQTYGMTVSMTHYCNIIGNDMSEAINAFQFESTYSSNHNNLSNNIAFNSSFGYYLYNSSNNTFTNNTARNNTDGGFIIEVDFNDNTFVNNTAYGNTQGFYLVNSSVNDFITNTAYDNVYGFYVASSSNGNTFTNNTARDNTNSGFQAVTNSNGNAFANNTAYNNIWYGFYSNAANGNTFTNNTAYDSIYGFALEYSNYSVLQRNVAYNNTHGFFMSYANGSTVSNSTSYNNANRGFSAANSVENNFTDSVAYGNGGYGVYSNPLAINRFTNTLVYNHTNIALLSADSPGNFTNLTLGYNTTVGIIRYQSINVTTGLQLVDGVNIYLRPDWVSLNGSANADANVPAYITINNSNCATLGVLRAEGFPTSMAEILTSGVHYNGTVKTCSGNLATFNVSGFSGYTLGKENTTLALNFTPSNVTTYGNETNVSCRASNGGVQIGLYVNGTLVAGPSTSYLEYLANHSGGYYNYTCNTTGNENYTSAANSSTLYVQKATTSLTLNIPVHPTSGEAVNVSCGASNSKVNMTLYRDGVALVNGTVGISDVSVLFAGSYTYVCNTSGNENYTSASAAGVLDGFQVSSSTGTGGTQCYLEAVAMGEVTAGSETAVQIFRYTDENPTRTPLYRATVNIIHGGSTSAYTTDTRGYVFFTPTETGTYTYAASFGDCYDTDGTFRVVEPTPVNIGFEPGCTSTISLYTEVCEEQESESTMGALACRQVPLAGEEVRIYGCAGGSCTCEGEDCTGLLGTFTTDSNGEVSIPYTDGNIVVVVAASGTHGPLERFMHLPAGSVCAQPGMSISFGPGCPSTITVTETDCGGPRTAAPGAPSTPCSGVQGVRVDAYRCSEPYIAELVQCDEPIGHYTTDEDGQATTDAVDGYIRLVIDAGDGVFYETSGTLPSSQECPECTSDSECGQDELCRGGQCVQRDQVPPEERPCTIASDCPSGYGCASTGLCAQLPPEQECTQDSQCAAGFLCRENACVDEHTVIGGGGVEGGGIAGILGSIISAVQKSFVFIVLLLALLLLLWFFFWKKRKGRRAPRTQEELIGEEQERPRRK